VERHKIKVHFGLVIRRRVLFNCHWVHGVGQVI